MLSTYDLKAFSIRLREIRKSLGYTQENVVTGTGLSAETLRKLENGISIPRYDTIEILSMFYKTDLHLLLNNYKSSRELLKYYDLVDYHVIHFDKDSILDTVDSFEKFMKTANSHLIDQRELLQLDLFFKGLALSYSDENNKSIQLESINHLIDALCLFNPTFSFSHWKEYKYNYLELRILFTIASLYGALRECILSNDILLFLYDSLDLTASSKHYDKHLITKVLTTISYNYHRLDLHENALKYAELGIEYCKMQLVMSSLPTLLVRKGTALYYLNQDGYEIYLNQSIDLLRIMGNDSGAELYEKLLLRYRKPLNAE